jgi:hypothetical protein
MAGRAGSISLLALVTNEGGGIDTDYGVWF